MSRARRKVPNTRSSRQDKALATRRRILEAAYRLVCEVGYGGTTMAAIADRAGVAEQTLYFSFRTKAAILSDVLHAAVVGFDRWSPDIDRDVHEDHRAVARERIPWFGPFEDEADPWRAIAIYVEGTAEIWGRVGPLLASLGAHHASEVADALAASEALREEASSMLVGALAKKGKGLRPSLSRRRAIDIFHVLTGGELYHELTARRGWSRVRAVRWLTELLGRELLGNVRGKGRGTHD